MTSPRRQAALLFTPSLSNGPRQSRMAGAFGWSCYGGGPAPLRKFRTTLVMAEEWFGIHPVGTNLPGAVVRIALSWMTDGSGRDGLFREST